MSSSLEGFEFRCHFVEGDEPGNIHTDQATTAQVVTEFTVGIEQVEAFVEKPLVALESLGLLGLGRRRGRRGQRRREGCRQGQPGK